MRRIVVVALSTLLLTGCLDWTQRGGNAGHTNAVAEDTLTAATVAGLTERWVAPGASGWVVTWGHRAVVAGPGGSMGVDTATGDVVWTGPRADQDVVIRDGVAYLARFRSWPGCERPGCGSAGSESAIAAVDVADGTPRPELSRTWPNGSMVGPWWGGGMATADHTAWVMLAIAYEPMGPSHPTLWVEVDGARLSTRYEEAYGYAALDAVEERVYVSYFPAGGPPQMDAWSLDGALLWRREVSATGVPKAVAGQVFTGREVLDGATGAELWRPQGTGGAVAEAFLPGEAYLVSLVGEVRAHHECGAGECPVAWSGTGAGLSQTIAVAGGVVYVVSNVGTEVQLRAYAAAGCGTATCAPLVTHTLTGQITGLGSLAVARGQVYVSTTTGLHAFGLP